MKYTFKYRSVGRNKQSGTGFVCTILESSKEIKAKARKKIANDLNLKEQEIIIFSVCDERGKSVRAMRKRTEYVPQIPQTIAPKRKAVKATTELLVKPIDTTKVCPVVETVTPHFRDVVEKRTKLRNIETNKDRAIRELFGS